MNELTTLDEAASRPDGLPKLPLSKKAQMVLDMVGIEAMCEMVMSGDRHSDIAKRMGVKQCDIGAWFLNHPERDLYRAAQEASAEALVDKAHDLLQVLADKGDRASNAEVALARLRSEALFKHAGFRSKRHREKQDADDLGAKVTIAPVFQIMAVAANEGRPAGVTVTQEGEGV